MKANQRVDKLQGQRGKCEDGHVDGLEDDTDDAKRFWELMGGKPDSLPDNPPADVEEKKDEEGGMKVFCVTDNKGGKVNMKQLEIEVDDKGKLDKKLLEEHDNDVLMA